jgi:hypothetical protein
VSVDSNTLSFTNYFPGNSFTTVQNMARILLHVLTAEVPVVSFSCSDSNPQIFAGPGGQLVGYNLISSHFHSSLTN